MSTLVISVILTVCQSMHSETIELGYFAPLQASNEGVSSIISAAIELQIYN